MKKNTKFNIRKLVDLYEPNGIQKSIDRLRKRYNYLKSKRKYPAHNDSINMRYIKYHLRKLGAM